MPKEDKEKKMKCPKCGAKLRYVDSSHIVGTSVWECPNKCDIENGKKYMIEKGEKKKMVEEKTYKYATIEIEQDMKHTTVGSSTHNETLRYAVWIIYPDGRKTGFSEITLRELFDHIEESLYIKRTKSELEQKLAEKDKETQGFIGHIDDLIEQRDKWYKEKEALDEKVKRLEDWGKEIIDNPLTEEVINKFYKIKSPDPKAEEKEDHKS